MFFLLRMIFLGSRQMHLKMAYTVIHLSRNRLLQMTPELSQSINVLGPAFLTKSRDQVVSPQTYIFGWYSNLNHNEVLKISHLRLTLLSKQKVHTLFSKLGNTQQIILSQCIYHLHYGVKCELFEHFQISLSSSKGHKCGIEVIRKPHRSPNSGVIRTYHNRKSFGH